MTRTLDLWGEYTRREAHDLLDPTAPFVPRAGTWGLQGIVAVAESPGDFAFFVTFGTSSGDHDFAEQITEDGVLTWQSQPAQRLHHAQIQQLINHDDLSHTIHLFLRTKAGPSVPYIYCGPLGYLDHDPSRDAPVHFVWQLLEWPPPAGTFTHPDINVPSGDGGAQPPPSSRPNGLHPVPVPTPRRSARAGGSGMSRTPRHPDQDARNTKLGRAGEDLVLSEERTRLTDAGRPDLAAKVVHVSVDEGDHVGYDVRSYELDGSPIYIEVKTTRGSAGSAFYVSPNELRFSETHPDNYVLKRLFRFRDSPAAADVYELHGSLIDHVDLTATEYRASLRSDGLAY